MPLYIHLSPAAQARVRDWYREHCLDYEWWDSDYDHWKDKLSDLGFTDADIKFSGFCCQGDGASFTANVTRHFKLPDPIAARIPEATAVAKVQRRFAGQTPVVDLSYDLSFRIERDSHQTGPTEFSGQEVRMGDACCECQRPHRLWLGDFVAHLVQHPVEEHVVSGHDVVEILDPVASRDRGEGFEIQLFVPDPEVVERSQEATVESVPEPKLGGDVAVEPGRPVLGRIRPDDIAGRVGKTRLIDNCALVPTSGGAE